MDPLLILVGAGLLYLGGESLVRGACNLARALGLSPLVIGLTVVSFGTSSPELAATLAASLRGAPDVAFGNVIGSNIANIGLILGLTGLVWPLATKARFLKREVPFMLVSSALLFPLVQNTALSRFEGALLLVLLGVFLVYLLLPSSEEEDVEREFDTHYGSVRRSVVANLLLVAVGVALLVAGARSLVDGAIGLARAFGVSERVIGLTVVALGTSLPELASSAVAAFKREGDIVLGNIVGSNIFNVLCILGCVALVRPLPVDPGEIRVDLVVMLALSLLLWPLLATRLRLDRWEAGVLLAAYAGYIAYLFR